MYFSPVRDVISTIYVLPLRNAPSVAMEVQQLGSVDLNRNSILNDEINKVHNNHNLNHNNKQ